MYVYVQYYGPSPLMIPRPVRNKVSVEFEHLSVLSWNKTKIYA